MKKDKPSKEILDIHLKNIKIAIKQGVTIAAGTDTLSPDFIGYGGREAIYLKEAGMSNLEIIEAFTANGPLTLGFQAPKCGILKKGYIADIIGLYKDPIKDITVLSNPKNIKYVFKNGKIEKSEKPHFNNKYAQTYWKEAYSGVFGVN